VAVVDSIGEILPLLGLSSNSPDDYTEGHRKVLRPLALAGAAVIGVDHLAKSADSRQAGPTGTAAKRRAVGGSSVRVAVRTPFAPGRGGAANLSIHKDRPGGLRAVSPDTGRGEQPAGVFLLEAFDDRLTWKIRAPTVDDSVAFAGLIGTSNYVPSQADLDAVASLDPRERTQRGVQRALRVGGDKAAAIVRAYKASQPE
jgi:hypothetical protein